MSLSVRDPRPAALAFAEEVQRIHHRYADEIVGAFRLCPFFRDAEASFGHFCVILDTEPDVATAREEAVRAPGGVVHLVYPLAATNATLFERFGSAVGKALEASPPPGGKAPVIAVFHPEMVGDAGASHRLVGLLRRAPDPFVQLVPEGLAEGGTVFAGADVPPAPDPAQANFERVRGSELDRLVAIMADIRADRDRSYAPHLAALSG